MVEQEPNQWWRRIRVWLLIPIFLIFVLIAAAQLRQNNVEMGNLREAVLTVDSENGDVESALTELQTFIFSHMNTQMSQPLNLVSSYNRAVEKSRKQAEQTGANPEVYVKAQVACEDPSVLLSVRAQCIQDYVIQNAPEGTDVSELEIPPKELYIYNFESPTFTLDLAGISILLATFTLAAAVIRTVAGRFF